jgi:GTP pyrophosphokinase
VGSPPQGGQGGPPGWLGFQEALGYAAALHRDQTRKATDIPYIAHLLGVASLALSHGATYGEATAALLHDAAEDQGGQQVLDEIATRFGADVARIVEECSEPLTRPRQPWRARKELYLAGIPTKSASALLVSLCDKVHNVQTIEADYASVGEALWERFTGGREGTLWYYRALVTAFAQRSGADPRLAPLLTELTRGVTAIEELAGRAT